jgi:hypothetical protein
MEPITSTAIGGGAVAIFASVGLFLRRLSRDKLEIARDRAEGNLISDLIKQRDDARLERDKMEAELLKIGEEADTCLEKVKELLSKEQQLRIQNAMLSGLLERLAVALDSSKKELAEALNRAHQSQIG